MKNKCEQCYTDKVCWKHGTYPDSIRPPRGEKCVDCKNGSSWKCRQPHICAAQIVKSPTAAGWEEDFDGKFKHYFAEESLRCKKCGHTKENHYWNGGGNQENSGYDRCKNGDCKCIDYDEVNDFEVKIDKYNDEYFKLKSFISSQISEAEKRGAKQALESLREEVEGVKKASTPMWLDTEINLWNAALKEVESVIETKIKNI